MHILDLPDDVFLDIFHFLEFEWFPDRVKNLKSLRLYVSWTSSYPEDLTAGFPQDV